MELVSYSYRNVIVLSFPFPLSYVITPARAYMTTHGPIDLFLLEEKAYDLMIFEILPVLRAHETPVLGPIGATSSYIGLYCSLS